jgi:hypothetical protein
MRRHLFGTQVVDGQHVAYLPLWLALGWLPAVQNENAGHYVPFREHFTLCEGKASGVMLAPAGSRCRPIGRISSR